MEFYYLADGSVVGTYNGMPYNFHPVVTPEQWAWFQEQLSQGLLTEIPKPDDPEPDPIDPVYAENQWREEQMARIANQLLMIEDEDPDAEPGTKRQWMDYRIALRKWVTDGNPDFPDQEKRPVAPT